MQGAGEVAQLLEGLTCMRHALDWIPSTKMTQRDNLEIQAIPVIQ